MMYSNNLLNFQESTIILNVCTKKSLETYWIFMEYIFLNAPAYSMMKKLAAEKW